ncbi:MAG TPA: putative maltokinase, partial [Pseudomonas sp.]|nr:putative maltokinase [Pseudomonas sp.]
ELVQAPARRVLENDVLATYLGKRRWFSAHAEASGAPSLDYALPFGDLRALAEVTLGGERYQLPLAYVDEKPSGSPLPQQLALARLRRGRQVGLLTDAFSVPDFTYEVLAHLHGHQVLPAGNGEIHFLPTAKFAEYPAVPGEEVQVISAEQSNSSVIIGERMVLKLVRRLFPGVHPEAEMGGFLTARGYANVAPMLGEVRRVDAQGQPHTLMILQGYLSNQGDAWSWTLNNLERAIRDELSGGGGGEHEYDALAELQTFAAVLGRRLGEMHQALAQPTDDPAFGARPSDEQDSAQWGESISAQLQQALDALDRGREHLNEADLAELDGLLNQREALQRLVTDLASLAAGGIRIRVHGDLHLGQVLVVQGDAYLIDFEGEPSRTLEQRRERHSPMKDVAGMLRSFDYAAALALRNVQGADSSAETEQLRQRLVARYRSEARTAFYDAYRLAAADLPHEWHAREGEGAALALFSLEKAAYEVLYEAAYRPDWVGVPLHGLLELIHQLQGHRR